MAYYRRSKVATLFRYVVIAFLCVVVLFPLYWMVLTTFQPEKYTLTFPPPLFLKGFDSSAISGLFREYPIFGWIGHSFLVGLVTVATTLCFAIPGAYVLSRFRCRGLGAFGFLLLFTQMMPGAMIVVPELDLYRDLNWTDNLFALSLLYAALNVPIACWILKSAFDTVPGELLDAATVDGSGRLGLLGRILLPITRPAVVAVMVVAFFGSWNDYIFASALLTNRSDYTAGLGIATFIGSTNIQLYQLEAGGVIFALVPAIMYMAVQRHVVRGLTAGALK